MPMSPENLPELLDRRALRDAVGLTRTDIDRCFQRCEHFAVDGSRKVYVHRDQVLALIRCYPAGTPRRQWEEAAA